MGYPLCLQPTVPTVGAVVGVALLLGLQQLPIPRQAENMMADLPRELFKNWVHSYEDDAEGIVVYRPSDYDFPPARGRAGISFRPDGSFIDFGIAATDGTQASSGHWYVDASGYIHLRRDGRRSPRVLRIVSVDANMLRVESVE